MKRVRFYIDLGLGMTHSKHLDFPEDATSATIQQKFDEWASKFDQGWEEMEDVPSIYKQEVNNDPGTDSVLLQPDSTEQPVSLGQQSEVCLSTDELHAAPSESET